MDENRPHQTEPSCPCPWADAARKWPDAVGMIGPDGRSATWMDLHVHIENAQESLKEMAEGPIGLQVTNQPSDLILLVAGLRSGRDVALFGGRAPKEMIESEAEQLGLHVVVSSDFPDPLLNGLELTLGESEVEDLITLSGSTLIRTSGSTGDPRWIRHQAAAHVSSAGAAIERLVLTRTHRWGWCLPAHHVGGLAILWRCALAGAAVVCQPTGMPVQDWLLSVGPKQSPTHLSLVPVQLKDVLESDVRPLTAFGSVIVGGAAVSPSLLTQAIESGWPVRTTYGMTETASMITLSEVWPEGGAESVHAGTALNGVDLSERNGRLYVRTPALGQDLADSDGWYATSDRARKDDNGRWVIEGRMDRVIISGGENLDPARIENALRSISGIEECIVVAIPDVRYGQRPIAFVSTSGPMPSRATCVAELQTRLLSFEIPDAILPLPPLPAGETKWSRASLEVLARSIGDL